MKSAPPDIRLFRRMLDSIERSCECPVPAQLSGNSPVMQLRNVLVGIITAIVLCPFSSTAQQTFKCITKTGQTIYSDVPCEKQNATHKGTVDTTPNEVGGSRPPSRAPRQAPAVSTTTTTQVPYINGYIGNRLVKFMVDTGASEVSIPYKKAIELGIPVFSGQRAESITASGKVGIYKIRLQSVTVGNVTVRNVAAHVSLNEAGSQDILLGMSFLRYVNLSMRNGVVSIGP